MDINELNFGIGSTKIITAKEAAKLLKVDVDTIAYLRKFEGLPFFKKKKYIMFVEGEVIRWRNRKLNENGTRVVNLKNYYNSIQMYKFCTYDEFKKAVSQKVFLDGDDVIQYIKKQKIWDDIKDVVGDIVSAYWNAKKPKCIKCGVVLHTSLPDVKYCPQCKPNKLI